MIICRSPCFGLIERNYSTESRFQNPLLTKAWYLSWRSGSRFPQVSHLLMTDLFNPHGISRLSKNRRGKKKEKLLYVEEDYLVGSQISCFMPSALLTWFFQHPILLVGCAFLIFIAINFWFHLEVVVVNSEACLLLVYVINHVLTLMLQYILILEIDWSMFVWIRSTLLITILE